VHASTAGLKALTTGFTADGIEECRKLCGGNGYLMASGLPDLYCAYVPACTYEGDNYILFLQVARYLMKVASLLASGEKLSGAAEYLGDAQRLCSAQCPAESAADFMRPEVQLEALSARAARMVVANGMRIQGAKNFEKAIADSAVEMVRMARAHCQQIVVSKFIEELQGEIEGRGVRDQLILLCNVYAVSQIEANLGDLLEVGYLQPKQAGWVHEALAELLTQVRPHAVNLVDAFNFSDHYLGSALGRYDGDVYTDLYARAWKEPLNQTDVVDGYEEHIRPLIKQQVWPVHSRL
jgi:acyl-CoA oxidase